MALINLQTSQKPKINVTNIKSPIGRLGGGVGSFRPLRMISSIFGRRRGIGGNLGQVPTTSVDETLLETNRILIEIQNQLAIDFATRITKETEDIKKIRATSDRRKRIEEEGKVESKKIGSVICKTFDKVVSPIKGIFGKLLGFFGWIGAGFLANKAIRWLSNNTEKIGKFFDVVANNWQLITGVVVGGLLLSVASKLAFAYRVVRSIFGIRGLRGVSRGGGQAAVRSISRLITQGHDSAASIRRTGITRSRGGVSRALRPGIKPQVYMGASGRITSATLGRAPGIGTPITRTTSNVVRRFISSSPNIRSGISKAAARIGIRRAAPRITGDVLTSRPALTRLGRLGQKLGTKLGGKGLGALPLIGNFWDLGSALYRYTQGDVVGGTLSLLSAIPILGWGAAALDISREFGAFDGTPFGRMGRKSLSNIDWNRLSATQQADRLRNATVLNTGTATDPKLQVLPAFDASGATGGAQAALPPAGGDSIPFVEAVDLANPWIATSREVLGIMV